MKNTRLESRHEILKENASEIIQRLYTLEEIKQSAKILRTLYHPLRHQILELINREGKMTTSDICERLNINQSAASQMLATLRNIQFVTIEKKGRIIYYKLNSYRLNQLLKLTKEMS